MIQPTLAERNRAANNTVGGTLGFGPTNTTGPLKLYVGQLHTSITEDMLGRIFDPFGKVCSHKVNDKVTFFYFPHHEIRTFIS